MKGYLNIKRFWESSRFTSKDGFNINLRKLTSNSHVSEEEPSSDKAFLGVSGRFLHDVKVRWVKSKGSCWETISDQVDPQQLDRDQSLRNSKGSSQENTAEKCIYFIIYLIRNVYVYPSIIICIAFDSL